MPQPPDGEQDGAGIEFEKPELPFVLTAPAETNLVVSIDWHFGQLGIVLSKKESNSSNLWSQLLHLNSYRGIYRSPCYF